ncbi:MAG: glycosyltransferase family 2 protein [Lachnospiraceae bacterium]|nr:glycosyltransferase family 2 protein [Lachnospiraceae bacterium]
MKTNLIMPMGGAGTRFLNNGFECPKPLIDLCGKPFFKWACDSVYENVELETLTFVVLKEHIERFGIDEKICSYYPKAHIEVLPHVLNGAVLTAIEGAKSIKNDLPVIFCDCDLAFKSGELYGLYNAPSFEADGSLLTFTSDLDRYSYVETDADGFALRTAEKKVISSHAITGAYGYRNAKLFMDAAKIYMDECEYSEYFMSGIYNILIREGRRIRVLSVDDTLNFGTPDEYEEAARRVSQGGYET